MKDIFVNLKRFEVFRELGGVCDMESPDIWIQSIVEECVQLGLGMMPGIRLNLLLPEALIIPAVAKLREFSAEQIAFMNIGCQSVYREDIKIGGNFGAFTGAFPATAAKAIGCEWSLIAHSEERRNLRQILEIGMSDSDALSNAVNKLLSQEVKCAIQAGLKVLYCVGETAEERGDGSFAEQKARIQAVLHQQLQIGLTALEENQIEPNKLAIAYEPIWAIGPGKVPPKADYIDFVSTYIKEIMQSLYGIDSTVVYGGGLKEENAAEIAGVKKVDGGLVALTCFSGNIGFYPQDLKKIIKKYVEV